MKSGKAYFVFVMVMLLHRRSQGRGLGGLVSPFFQGTDLKQLPLWYRYLRVKYF